MPAQETTHRGRKLLAVAVLALLVLLSAVNFRIVKTPLAKLIRHETGFVGFVDEIQKGYLSDSFARKNVFLNLNGLFARLTGRRTLNNVVRLNNGMLGEVLQKKDMTAHANAIIDFADYLSERNIPFLYIQMPWKESLDGQSFPVGITSYANENADDLLSRLSVGEVDTLDLRPRLSQTPEMLEQYFYRTDAHWNNDGAFIGFQEVLSYLHEMFPEKNVDLTYAQTDQWERHSIDDWFLGNRGKRVGAFFGGTDPLIWYTPKFETEMSRAVPRAINSVFYRGNFTEANINTQYIEGKDYFGYNNYEMYVGLYPLVQHRNLYAPSPLKVMIIRDSFTLPLQAYLSTVFQEIDVIDPNVFSECTVAEYAEQTEPDIVIYALSPFWFADEKHSNFGVEAAGSTKVEEGAYELVAQLNIVVDVSDGNNHNFRAYPLENNTVYRVSFDGVEITGGQIEGVSLRLFDKETNAVPRSMIFDLAYCEAADGFSWVFRTPDTQQDELYLLFYAGLHGFTAGNGVIYRGVTVEKIAQQ